jgi:uncharacterized protein YndB with AHSA1/START domain
VIGANELTYRRVHRASPALLFEVMTTPAHLARFWGPAGTTTPEDRIVVELRPGGRFETTMVSEADGAGHTMRAVYEVVEPPHRLVWREVDTGMRTTVTFIDNGDGTTEVVTHQVDVPDAYMTPEARAGFATSLERVDRYLATLTA